MGLDMYLYAKKFIWTDFQKQEQQLTEFAENPLTLDLVEAGITKPKIRYITIEAAYWRKAHEIHQWFVQNVQDNIDECQIYDVELDQLIQLKEICQNIILIPSAAPQLLPLSYVNSGYDDWYFQQLKQTVQQIEECEKYPQSWQFQYRASW